MVHPPCRDHERLRPVRPFRDVVPVTLELGLTRGLSAWQLPEVQLRPRPAATLPRVALFLPVVRLREPRTLLWQELAVLRDGSVPRVPVEQPQLVQPSLVIRVDVRDRLRAIRCRVRAPPEADNDEIARGSASERERDGRRARPGDLRR